MENREVALMGRMTAGMTHELKNVLATIKECSGLLQDILGLSKGDAVPRREQIEKMASRIEAQVARGNEQLASLNWLGHSVSDRSTAVGINELSSEIVKLMQRFARLKQVELAVQQADPDVTLRRMAPKGRRAAKPMLGGCPRIWQTWSHCSSAWGLGLPPRVRGATGGSI